MMGRSALTRKSSSALTLAVLTLSVTLSTTWSHKLVNTDSHSGLGNHDDLHDNNTGSDVTRWGLGQHAVEKIVDKHNDLRRNLAASWKVVKSGHAVCVDDHPHCPWWALRGECHVNPAWMLDHCHMSCKMCYPFDTPCGNSHPKCQEWADRGECDRNPLWMGPHCNKSCSTCPHTDLPEIQWDTKLADYAKKLVDKCQFKHDANSRYGENIFWAGAQIKNPEEAAVKACAAWGREKQRADKRLQCACGMYRDRRGRRVICGHYSQMLWRTTTKIGCAYRVCGEGTHSPGTHVFCEYSPRGNKMKWNGADFMCEDALGRSDVTDDLPPKVMGDGSYAISHQ